jgi:type I restriction enzyme M protein
MTDVVAQLWNYCHTLRHDGVDYGDYIEQLTYLLFLKMADERDVAIPAEASWQSLRDADPTEALKVYEHILWLLSMQPGILGDIYAYAENRLSNDRNLLQLVGLIDRIAWSELGVDVQAAAFEGLLEKAAAEGKKGAGQYFTPRPLIDSIVRLTQPNPLESRDFALNDPACGTGGFIAAAYDWLLSQHGGSMSGSELHRIANSTYYGQELVKRPRRLALMNLYLRGLQPNIRLGDAIYGSPDTRKYDVVLTNPPFGTRGAGEVPDGTDFFVRTASKQLNFIQRVISSLKAGGRAAMVLPDNALFDDRASEVFRTLSTKCDVHTLLRCPRGTFSPYTEGTNTNVVFFVKGRSTERIWVYDARTNVPKVTKRVRPLSESHFADFEQCFGADPNGRAARHQDDSFDGRWRSFSIQDVADRHFKLDALRWLNEDVSSPTGVHDHPAEMLTSAMEYLSLAMDSLADLQSILGELTSQDD